MKRNSSPSSRRSGPAPDLAPRPSRRGRRLALAGHALAVSVLPTIDLPTVLLLPLLLGLAWSAWSALRPTPWTRLTAGPDGSWTLVGRDGRPHRRATLLAGGLCHPWLVTLPFRLEEGGRCTVLLFADALPGEVHRELRVWLRGAAAGVSAGGC